MRRNTPAVFWSRIDQSGGPEACWPWRGRRKKRWHGVYDHDGTWSYAHRYVYELVNGPPQHFVLHHCDNSICCNPAHLYDGTQLENVQDRDRRGRRIAPTGESSGRAKLTDAQAEEIKSRYASGQHSHRTLGVMYGVDRTTIGYIVTGKRRPANGPRFDASAADTRSRRRNDQNSSSVRTMEL